MCATLKKPSKVELDAIAARQSLGGDVQVEPHLTVYHRFEHVLATAVVRGIPRASRNL